MPRQTMTNLLYGPGGTLRDGWRVMLFALGAGACSTVAGAMRLALPEALEPWLPAPWFPFLGLACLTWLFLQLEGRPLASVGLALDRRWGLEFLGGVLAGAGLMALMALSAFLGGGCRWEHSPHASMGQLAAGAWLYLGVAGGEELLFRGYPFQRLVRSLGRWPALALGALLFTALHWGNPGMTGATRAWACLNIALAGLLLGLCWLWTRSLALPVGLHLGWNWTQGTLLGFGVSGLPSQGWWSPVLRGGPAWITGGAFGLEAGLPARW
jgi:hypothetical protein